MTTPARGRSRVRLWHGCCEPAVLWLDGEAVEPGDLDLSEALQRDLVAYQEFVQAHLLEAGWDDEPARVEHEARARDLHRRLERELGEPVDLHLDVQRVGW